MSFWTSRTGLEIDGSDKNAFNDSFATIPDGTMAPAMIKTFELQESEQWGPRYSIRWRIMEGDFKGREINQSIYAFADKPEKVDKALNMLMRVYKLCDHKPTHKDAPTTQDLSPMQGKMCGIKIAMLIGKEDGKERNYVSEVHSLAGFEAKTGAPVAKTTSQPVRRHTDDEIANLHDDLPF